VRTLRAFFISGVLVTWAATAGAQCAPPVTTLIAHRDFAGARRFLDRQQNVLAIASRPDSEPPYSFAGAFYRRQHRWADAISMYEKAARLLPAAALSSRAASIHYLLGDSKEKSGQPSRARAEYATALRYNPNHREAKKALEGLGEQ